MTESTAIRRAAALLGIISSRKNQVAWDDPHDPQSLKRFKRKFDSVDARSENEGHANTNNHASELQPHKATPPNTGNSATDKKYQQQQDKLAAKQTQEHQKLQQQQEKEHQQATKKNYTQMEQHQAPHQTAPAKQQSRPPAEKPY
jgi:hypothetical protein